MSRFGELVEQYRYPVRVWAESLRDWSQERTGRLRHGLGHVANHAELSGDLHVELPERVGPHIADQAFISIGGRGDTSRIGDGLDVVGPQVVIPPTPEAR